MLQNSCLKQEIGLDGVKSLQVAILNHEFGLDPPERRRRLPATESSNSQAGAGRVKPLQIPTRVMSLGFRLFCLAFLLGLVLMMSGCEETNQGTIDTTGNNPQISNAFVSPDTVNVDTLTAVSGLYTIQAAASVAASDPDGDLNSVVLNAFRSSSPTTTVEVSLHDDGVSPDLAAGDGIFSGVFELTITRPEAGPYRIQFMATDGRSLTSNILELTLYAARTNSPPSLDAQSILAPDTVVVPVGGFAQLEMSIAAQDSDGLADIRSVYFLSPDGGNPDFRFPLRDDGGFDLNLPSGDDLAGDGIFSIILGFSDSPTIRGTYRLFFHAEDSFGDTSASVLHTLTIR